jgi:hypothetical protein
VAFSWHFLFVENALTDRGSVMQPPRLCSAYGAFEDGEIMAAKRCGAAARDAMMLDYRVIMISDANAALTDERTPQR